MNLTTQHSLSGWIPSARFTHLRAILLKVMRWVGRRSNKVLLLLVIITRRFTHGKCPKAESGMSISGRYSVIVELLKTFRLVIQFYHVGNSTLVVLHRRTIVDLSFYRQINSSMGHQSTGSTSMRLHCWKRTRSGHQRCFMEQTRAVVSDRFRWRTVESLVVEKHPG